MDVARIIDDVEDASAAYVAAEAAGGCRAARTRMGPLADREWRRIAALPRIDWTPEHIARAIEVYTAKYRRPGSTATLRAVQAIALAELRLAGGLVGAMRVGAGKTLITILAPLELSSVRPLMLQPASLIEKTREEWSQYSCDWRVPPLCPIMSYEQLARENQADYLEDYRPTMIVADECHALANLDTSAAKRVRRYLATAACRFVGVSGTLTDRSLLDYAHLLSWALSDGSPVPREYPQQKAWSDVIDAGGKGALGAMSKWSRTREGARRHYRDLLTRTPGFVATSDRPHRPTSRGRSEPVPLAVRRWRYVPDPATTGMLVDVVTGYELPDGQTIPDALSMTRHCYTIALGYWLRWRYPPPKEWADARRVWHQWCRHVIRYQRRVPVDTEEQARNRLLDGTITGYDEARSAAEHWLSIRGDFVPETETVWHSRETVDAIMQWSRRPGIVWYEHTAIGEALREQGLPVYGQQSLDAVGRSIREEDGSRAIAASVRSSGTGLNLQAFSRNLVLEPASSGKKNEQMIGRTHRDGQARDVSIEYFIASPQHQAWIDRAHVRARYQADTLGQDQKLLYAEVNEIESKKEKE